MIGEGGSYDESGTGEHASPIDGLAVPELSQHADLGQADGLHFHDETRLSVKNENRPDRGWQKVGDVALRVVKAAVVTGAIRGYIPRPVASHIVGNKKLRDA